MQPQELDVIGTERTEHELLSDLRRLRRSLRRSGAQERAAVEGTTFGQRIADTVAGVMGPWTFIIVQSAILLLWVLANLVSAVRSWDPYPFILLNLALSFQAAYAAPVIMMSQNRQQDIDRKAAENDYKINVKAELEIELLHEKMDQLRAKEVLKLMEAVARLTELLQKSAGARNADATEGGAPYLRPRARRTARRHNGRLSTPWRKVISPLSNAASNLRVPSKRATVASRTVRSISRKERRSAQSAFSLTANDRRLSLNERAVIGKAGLFVRSIAAKIVVTIQEQKSTSEPESRR